ncbi:protein TPR3 isoform X1 [Pyrus x bretschneideri]|uniref:protein TPR3 isoform X1 n=1 Tax=Pyrus x bretschneideri TaxID=225117 RepID=UPI002030D494|nr:protein TPR3 isoform X1 [Pyrus x bretschneideri]XP_048425991.1 protein TPR3 isoform X1 [Pyrus x bretschneideri]XP_048425992.1 protein TPR3 isoform X1 [Pyrus x bretschneideri]XP_048425993.1 protein TPR3 isoform X1 [Pyrus x bretschneideri]XP_048425994.1 protein TPR3 isoform X1 [Pyrus x bretschneideri]XP_048425995.1 protein TPR3 isoform X1 [Pyrus x bretschneideri]
MDFHPVQHTLLLGTNAGDISLWEVSSRDKLMSRSFQVWDIGASSMMLKATLIKDPCVSVKRILWSPMVLYLELHIQLYSYFGGNEIHQHLEVGSASSTFSVYFILLFSFLILLSISRSMLILTVLMIWRSATWLCNFVPYLAVMIRPLRYFRRS